jgi:hypothetical protein
MTAHKAVILECNVCEDLAIDNAMTMDDLVHEAEPVTTAHDARQAAHAKGWRHDKLGRDLCPNCQTVPRSPSKLYVRSHD